MVKRKFKMVKITTKDLLKWGTIAIAAAAIFGFLRAIRKK
jgi:hypothetical protein